MAFTLLCKGLGMLYPVIVMLLTWGVCMPLRFHLKEREHKGLSLLLKAIPTALVAGCAGYAVAFDPAADAYARLIFIGLCVCVAADVLLDIRFEVGGGLFFAGHVLYVLALSVYKPLSWWSLTVFVLAGGIMQYFLNHYRKQVSSRLIGLGLRIYALALAALLAFSIPLPFLAYSHRAVMAAVGAVMFVLSDLTLCHNTLRHKPVSWHYVSLGVYYTGQLLLGLSALHIP